MLKHSLPTTYHTAGTPYSPAEDRCYMSGPEIIRRRGGNPIETLEQQARRCAVENHGRHLCDHDARSGRTNLPGYGGAIHGGVRSG